MAELYKGALLDEREESLKALDFHDQEIPLAAGPVVFPEVRNAKDLPFYERRDQDGSSTCMNQAYAKLRGIMKQKSARQYVSLSGGFAYRRRYNQPGEGMALFDILALGKNHGLPFEAIDPSQNMRESEIVNAKEIVYADDVAKLFTDPNEKYIYLPHNFDAIAAAVSQGYPVLLMIYCDRDEYEIRPVVKRQLTPATAAVRHGVCAHAVFQESGEEYILMDDSWGVPSSKAQTTFDRDLKERGQRRLTREFVNTRVYGAAYVRDLNFNFGGEPVVPTPPDLGKPKYRFTKQLHFLPIDKIDSPENEAQKSDVKALQDILKFEGIFERGIPSSGYYGAITARAVVAYQRKYAVASPEEIDTITGPNSLVGPKTLEHLNNNYAQ